MESIAVNVTTTGFNLNHLDRGMFSYLAMISLLFFDGTRAEEGRTLLKNILKSFPSHSRFKISLPPAPDSLHDLVSLSPQEIWELPLDS